jgi:hypothetical protein
MRRSSHAVGTIGALNATRRRRRNWPLDDYRSFNALAETVNGLYKAEFINPHGLWKSVEQVEVATADRVHF